MKNDIELHFKKFANYVNSHDSDAYNHAWLLIRKSIEKAFDVSSEDYGESGNDRLVNDCIDNERLRKDIHNVRIIRNELQHGSITGKEFDFKELLRTVDKFRKYINENSKTNFKLKYETTVEKEQIESATKEVDLTNNTGPRFEGRTSDEILKKSSIICTDENKKTVYRIAYGDSRKVFTVLGNNIDIDCKFPILAIIHNILIRGTDLEESTFLKEKNLNNYDLEDVYVYEILILRLLMSGNVHYDDRIKVGKNKNIASALALGEIRYYVNLLNKISNTNYRIPDLEFVDDKEEYYVEIDSRYCRAEMPNLKEEDIYSPIVLSSFDLKCEVTGNNIEAHNQLARELFDIDTLRPGQIDALKEILSKNKTSMIILPTGYGKSLIYQYISFLQAKVSLIVSPTNTLIFDQCEGLKKSRITRVAKLDSKIDDALKEWKKEKNYPYFLYSQIVYCTPEEIQSSVGFSLMKDLQTRNLINLISVDEFHQVSIWGHKFDPRYFTLISQLVHELEDVSFALFSATASRRVIEDIKRQLTYRRIDTVQPCPLNRDNINFQFICANDFAEIENDIVRIFDEAYQGGGIFDLSNENEKPSMTLLICNDSRILENINRKLSYQTYGDCVAVLYHENEEKTHKIYSRFRDGDIRFLLTNDEELAGINIPFLNNLIIVGFPPSMEWLYQESGRVGRDGDVSNVIIYYDNLDGKIVLNDDTNKWQKQFKNNTQIGLSNIANIEYFNYKSEDIQIAWKILKAMFECSVYNPDNKIAVIDGFINRLTLTKYDIPLFLLYYSGIVNKWIFDENLDNGEIKYNFEVPMEVLSSEGFEFSIENIKKRIARESVNREIQEIFFNEFNDIDTYTYEFAFDILAKWMMENSAYTHRQMFIGVYSLIEESDNKSSIEIEKKLAAYFGVGTKNPVKIRETKKTEIKQDKLVNSLNKHKFGKNKIFDTTSLQEIVDLCNNENADGIINLGVKLERDIEYEANVNVLAALSLVEILSTRDSKYVRTGELLNTLNDEETIDYLNLVRKNTKGFHQKNQFDKYLISHYRVPIFYTGIIGKIARKF